MPVLTVCSICTTLESEISFSPTFPDIIHTVWQQAIYQKSHPLKTLSLWQTWLFLKWKMIQFIHLFLNSCQNSIKNTVILRVHGISQFSLYKSTEALSKADHINEQRVDLTLVLVTNSGKVFVSPTKTYKNPMNHPPL